MTDTRFKILRIGGRCYPLRSLSVGKLRRIAPWVARLRDEAAKEGPEGFRVVARIVSIALAGNGPLGRLAAGLLYQRFLREAGQKELAVSMNAVLEMIPVREYYTLNLVSAEFDKLIAR